MEKKSLKSLDLGKIVITDLSLQNSIKGGATSEETCSDCGGSCCGTTNCSDSCDADQEG
ncbi:hypothetical protein [Sinomicrobium pectinilyticum]|uniref:hypothetical protein n=1 Tax=Sinomicrobium pectinilyticum TaxID=1084421 RepID=UPI0014755459|nr:hypothetical protein [Sinomicrobium pectinilyticum]